MGVGCADLVDVAFVTSRRRGDVFWRFGREVSVGVVGLDGNSQRFDVLCRTSNAV